MTDRNYTEFKDSSFQERRQDPHSQTYRMLFENLSAAIKELSSEVKDVKAKVNYHHATYQEATERAVSKAMLAAFPEGDADGHRRHHEAVIKAAEEKAEFWQAMRKKLGEWGVVGFAGWALYALWIAFLAGPKK